MFCRNINYSNQEDYHNMIFCTECSLSKFGKFEFTLNCRQGYSVEKILNEKMKNAAQAEFEKFLTRAQTNHAILKQKKETLLGSLKSLDETAGGGPSSSDSSFGNPFMSSGGDLNEVRLSKSMQDLANQHAEAKDIY